jgi:hypothetical protein
MNKAIYFDMDGTIANLYDVENWLPMLRAEDPTPYLIAEPKVDMAELVKILDQLKNNGYTIGIITWLSMNSTEGYKKKVREAKAEWIKKYFPFNFDVVHMVQYGTPKHIVAKIKKGILVDDNKEVRADWLKYGGDVIDAEPKTWLDNLRKLV